MQELSTWSEILIDSFRSFGQRFMGALPSLIGAILIFLIGWLIARLLAGATTKLLKLVKFDQLSERANVPAYLAKANISLSPSRLIGKFVFWILILVVLITAADTLGWDAVSAEISRLVGYLPKLAVAIAILIVGAYFSAFVRDVIAGATNSLGISAGKLLATFVFYLLLIVITLTALNQAGINTEIIGNNVLLILGAILATASISYGLASRDVLRNILAGYFGQATFKSGMEIEVDGIRGVIIDKSNIALILQTKDKNRVILPTSKLVNHTVKIIVDSDQA